ncbi:MAG: DUF2914 domain-containing protein [Ignavibacteria bacterium]|nr:DUF2914 domain-containing protein [Ignavibacteria bacterium]MBI3766204.1 DUF2914 domain-containing protein [Ignavibacteriales bacterium]
MKRYSFYILSVVLVFLCIGNSPAQQESTGSKGLQVIEAKLAKDVKDRMPVDEDSVFTNGSKVFLWMKLTGGSSDQITVTWKTENTTHATTLTIGGSPWRTWASKGVWKTGNWTVTVTDASGKVLKEMNFKVE